MILSILEKTWILKIPEFFLFEENDKPKVAKSMKPSIEKDTMLNQGYFYYHRVPIRKALFINDVKILLTRT